MDILNAMASCLFNSTLINQHLQVLGISTHYLGALHSLPQTPKGQFSKVSPLQETFTDHIHHKLFVFGGKFEAKGPSYILISWVSCLEALLVLFAVLHKSRSMVVIVQWASHIKGHPHFCFNFVTHTVCICDQLRCLIWLFFF